MLSRASPIGGQSEAEDDGPDDAGHGREHRDQATAAEERQRGGQLRAVVALPQQGRGDADDDAAEDPGVDGVRRRDLHLAGEVGVGDGGLQLEVGCGVVGQHVLEHQVADQAGQGRGPVGLLREADGDAEGEEHREVVEDRPTGQAQDLERRPDPAEQVILAEAQQQAGRRQDCDGQHEALADTLQRGEGLGTKTRFLLRGGARRRCTHSATSCSGTVPSRRQRSTGHCCNICSQEQHAQHDLVTCTTAWRFDPSTTCRDTDALPEDPSPDSASVFCSFVARARAPRGHLPTGRAQRAWAGLPAPPPWPPARPPRRWPPPLPPCTGRGCGQPGPHARPAGSRPTSTAC